MNELTTFNNTNEMVFNPVAMDQMMKLAEIMAKSNAMVPQHLRNSVGDCFAIIMQASQWRMNPFAVAQKTHCIKGTLGYEGQLVNAVIVNNGPVKGRFKYEFIGEWSKILGRVKHVQGKKPDENGELKTYLYPDWKPEDERGLGVIVSNTIIGDDEPTSITVYMVQAMVRNSTQWASDPQQQLSYLAIKKWARRHCPDVILGVYTPDEVEEDEIPQEKEINPIQGKADPENRPLTFDETVARIKTSMVDDFNDWIDRKLFSKSERLVLKTECDRRRKQLEEMRVVATQYKEPEPAAATQAEPEQQQGSGFDWLGLIESSIDPDAMMAVATTVPDAEMPSVIVGIKDNDLLNRFYKALPKEKQVQYNHQFDTHAQFLETGE